MATQTIDNIEELVKVLQQETELTDANKYNGISLYTSAKITKTKATQILKQYKLLPVSLTTAKFDNKLTVIELPEFEPYYTEEQNLKIYTDSINYIIETNIQNSKIKGIEVTKQLLLRDADIYVNTVIQMYYKSFVNTYKAKLTDFTMNNEYRISIKNLFVSIVNKYPIKEK